MPHAIEIRLLGRFSVQVEGRELAPALPRRAAELVQLLALQPDRNLLHEQLLEALWPHLDPQAGSANLRKAAHHARQALGLAEALVLRGGRVALCPGQVYDCDVSRFECAAEAALRAGDPGACAAAAALYAGELLPQARYAPWSEEPRQRLREAFLRLLRQAGDWERLAREEPTDEAAHQALMRTALAEGRPAHALRWWEHLRDHLAQSLGLRPGAQTQALYQACLAQAGPPAPSFVGRSPELARLLGLLQPGTPHALAALLSAPAGMGKSSLCTELAAQAASLGWVVHRAEAEAGSRPYGLLVELVESVLRDEPQALLQDIGSHARTVLAHLTGRAGPAAPLPGPLSRHQVTGALRRLLLAAAGARPVLLVADNLEASDEASAEALVQLAAGHDGLVLVFAARPNLSPDLQQGLARLRRGGRLLEVELPPLTPEPSRVLARSAAPEPLDDATLAWIVERAQGHPFALVELARAAAAPGRAIAPDHLPASVAAAIEGRLCDVDPGTCEGLRRLACAGEDLETPAVMALVGDSEPEALQRLDRAWAAGLLQAVHGRWRFVHALVREALVEGLPAHRHPALHREVASRLAAAAGPPALVARHWLAAGQVQAAAPFAVAAAREAARLSAYADVLRQVEPVLARWPGYPQALALRAEALDALGRPGALAAYDEAAAVAEPELAHELRAKRALAQVKSGDPQGALRDLVGVCPTTVAGKLSAALAYSGAAALGYGDPAEGTRRSAECRRLALEAGDGASLLIASWAHAAAAHARGELHESVWADLQETHALPHLAMRVFDGHLCITQRFLYGARPYAQVIAFADALAAEAERLGAARGLAFAVTLRGEARLLNGQLDAAEQDLVAGGRLHRAIGGATGEALSLQRRAELALHHGRPRQARGLLDEALDVARQSDVGFHLLDRIYGTRVALARDPDAALLALEEADAAVRGPLETCPGCRINFAVPATIAAARARELELAAAHERSATYLADVVMKLPAWSAALQEARGHVALAAGQRAHAVQAFAEAAQAFAAAGHPLDHARCRMLAGAGAALA